MKVLIAEDDAVSSVVLAARIRKMGHDVTVTENGREAWDAFLRDRPRLVITDWMMPEVNGIELCRRIRADENKAYTYVILLTSLSGKADFREGMEAGADDFVMKPLDTDGLQARLRVAERVIHLQREVMQLQGLLPICAYCKRIRDDHNDWHPVEQFVGQKTETEFSHTLCPECIATPTIPKGQSWD